MTKKKLAELKTCALNARRLIISASAKAGSVHIASSLSPVDILVALYFDILRINPENMNNPDRDRFILSKGHGGLGLYAVLAERGIMLKESLERYCQDNTNLAVHPVYGSVLGIEATSGSLGHGLGIGLGLALAQKRDNRPSRSFVLLSDGECDEGSTWEAIMLAGHLKMDNLIAIVDYNKIQSFGSVSEVLDLEPFAAKWRANCWECAEIDGHNFEEILTILNKVPLIKNKPTVIVAHTIKGKGVPFMENKLEWHYRNVLPKDLEQVLKEVY
jgi:transketolase